MSIEQGALLGYAASFRAGGVFPSPEEVVARVAVNLSSHGFPLRGDPNIRRPPISVIVESTLLLRPYSSHVELEVQNLSGFSYGDPDDIRKIIDHEFLTATNELVPGTNELPTGGRIFKFQNPGSSSILTGEPGPDTSAARRECTSCADTVDCQRGFFSKIECGVAGFFGGLTTTAFSVLALVLIAVLVGLVIIRKELPGIAGAARG